MLAFSSYEVSLITSQILHGNRVSDQRLLHTWTLLVSFPGPALLCSEVLGTMPIDLELGEPSDYFFPKEIWFTQIDIMVQIHMCVPDHMCLCMYMCASIYVCIHNCAYSSH